MGVAVVTRLARVHEPQKVTLHGRFDELLKTFKALKAF